MSTLTIDYFDPPTGPRTARWNRLLDDRAADELAGRTVWCATALPAARPFARSVRDHVAGTGRGVAADWLEVTADEPLRQLAERLDAMLGGMAPPQPLGPAEVALYADGATTTQALVGSQVAPGDVVVANDALTALLAQAVRDRGAHAVWHIHVVAPNRDVATRAAREFLEPFTTGFDAYVMTWEEPAPHGRVVERVAAAIPSAGMVAAKEIPARSAADEPGRMAWNSALAEVVQEDRDERVGGRLHPRPQVAGR
jgi:hypothetical protein